LPGENEHERILKELAEHFKPLFEQSPEGIYLYLDEVHKICNQRFAAMFGLTVEEWQGMDGFVNKHVADRDQDMMIRSYHEHIHQSLTPARFRMQAVRKDKTKFNVEVDMIPLPWRGEMVALHFVRAAE
jgi:PAS domain S-box-containing protein